MEHVLCGATYIKSLKILKIIFMKKSIPAFAILLSGSILFAACNGSNSNNTNTDSTTTSSTMTSDTNKMDHTMTSSSDTANNMTVAALDDASKKFIEDAGKGGMMEVDLGNMAINNASSQAVKDFGKMMVDDHTKLNNELKDLADKKNVQIPATVSEKQQKEMDQILNFNVPLNIELLDQIVHTMYTSTNKNDVITITFSYLFLSKNFLFLFSFDNKIFFAFYFKEKKYSSFFFFF